MTPLSSSEDPRSGDRCAYYGHVSTPRQNLEHQREHVNRYCAEHAISIPDSMRFEDKEKRHRSDKREGFQRLLAACKRGEVDWIIVASFDRWGVADPDEFFEFRGQLKRSDVQLWSVVDRQNLTGLSEGDYFRIVALAIGASRYVEQMAEKNILKMIEMAKQGWATTGNAPYGVDLVCFPLLDASKPLFRVVRLRVKEPHLYRVIHADGRVEETERMPLRDKKGTVYRYLPTVESQRLVAVKLMFELYDGGMGFSRISEMLWEQGHKHYDKPFGYHGVETILSNPVYIGRPAWGKVAVGAYYVLLGGQPTKVRRKSTEPLTYKKDDEHVVQPLVPVFDPIVSPELFARVQVRLGERGHVNPSFGKRRTRDRTTHPLNGKVVCGDCGNRMVQQSTMSKGITKRYFICGLYRKTMRKKCHANSVPWSKLDGATDELLAAVNARLGALITHDPSQMPTMLQEAWAKKSELGSVVCRIVNGVGFRVPGVQQADHDDEVKRFVGEQIANGKHPTAGARKEYLDYHPDGSWTFPGFDMLTCLDWAFRYYNSNFEADAKNVQGELQSIDSELENITQAIIGGIPSATVRSGLNKRMSELETRKTELKSKLVPLTSSVESLVEQVQMVQRSIDQTDAAARAKVLDLFIDRVVPKFGGDAVAGRERDVSFEFFPRDAQDVLAGPMEIRSAPTGTGSWRPRGGSRPGSGSSPGPGPP
jgi:DNA invertase Pin-like site-specific DNA recombinase